MKNLQVNNAIIFDFDGVVLTSHLVKTQAFYYVFKIYGNNLALKAQKLHLNNTGVSRLRKFKYILKKIIKINPNRVILNDLQQKFSGYINSRIAKLKVRSDLINFLRKYQRNFNFYISTGTPQKEIEKILKQKKIFKYFKGVYGSPRKKINHINKIKKKNKKLIFIGDSKEDYLAAKKSKIFFIAKINTESRKYFKNKNIKKINDFKNLNFKINELIF